MTGNMDRESVRRVRRALVDAGLEDSVIELAANAGSARQAADAIGVELGAIVKSLVFVVGGQAVMVLIAGDRRCKAGELSRAFSLAGEVARADAARVRAETGCVIGGVAPIGLKTPLPTVIDVSLKRFERVYAAAGHAHCVFPATVAELKRLTGGIVSYAVAEPDLGAQAD